MVAMIMIRVLKKDISKYNSFDFENDLADDNGWKLVHGDVFRNPNNYLILSILIGNGILSYVSTGNSVSIIMVQEILIASIGLLAVPKKMRINIENMTKETKYLPRVPEKRLEESKETVYRLNNVSEAISEIAKSYKDVGEEWDFPWW